MGLSWKPLVVGMFAAAFAVLIGFESGPGLNVVVDFLVLVIRFGSTVLIGGLVGIALGAICLRPAAEQDHLKLPPTSGLVFSLSFVGMFFRWDRYQHRCGGHGFLLFRCWLFFKHGLFEP